MQFKDLFRKQKIKDWLVVNAEGPQSSVFLFSISFIESIFFPIPPDFILMTILAARKNQRWAYYSAITTIASTLGGVLMYTIGHLFFQAFGEAIVSFYHLAPKFDAINMAFQKHTFLAILFAASAPIPESYKVAAMAGGLFKVNLPLFILASIIGRGGRFFLVGFFMKLFGHKIAHHVYKHLGLIATLISIAVGVGIYFLLK